MNEVSHNFSDLKAKVLSDEIENMRVILPLMIEHQSIYAKITRAKFLALLDAGFTRQEAFALCK
jgi:hypothetical protein